MSTMMCGTCVAPGQFELTRAPRLDAVPEGWVLVEIAAAGICGTDYHIFEGKQPYLSYPRVIGHELSGKVVDDAEGWRAGDLVVINPYLSCRGCRACLRGKPNCCEKIEVLGVHRDGGMCERIAVPAGNLYRAEGLSPLAAAMVEFLAIGAHAVRRAELTPGDRVLVTGAGPIGLGAALFARLSGAEVHLLDTSPARLAQVAMAFGFEHTHLATQPLLVGALSDGFDTVFDATGNARAIESGFANVAHGGSYVLISVVQGEIHFSDPQFHKREMRLIGSRNATDRDFLRVMDALSDGTIDASALCSETIALADLPSRLPELARDRDGIVKAIVTIGRV